MGRPPARAAATSAKRRPCGGTAIKAARSQLPPAGEGQRALMGHVREGRNVLGAFGAPQGDVRRC